MSTMDILRFVLCALSTLTGLFFIISAVFGTFRFRHALDRLHCAALIDTAGMFFMLLGLCFALGFTLTSLKLIVIITLLWITSPVASHLISRLHITVQDDLSKEMQVTDEQNLTEIQEEK